MDRNTKLLILLLKELAEQKEVTAYKIGKDTGITEHTIRKYFNLEITPSLDKFLKIANSLGVNFFFDTKDESIDLAKAFKKASNQINESDYFTLQKSEKEGYWVAVHKKANIVVEFEEGKFDETQKVTNIYDFEPSEYGKIPTYMRQLGDWLYENHKNLL